MKATIVAALALVCVLGVVAADWGSGYSAYYPEQKSGGLSSLLPLLLLLILLPTLFGSSLFSSGGQGDTTIIFSNISGPTGGK